jgi:quercetin dioxygenase-like cupin family protein
MKLSIFPEPILHLPAVEVPVKGLETHLAQGDTFQIVFMSFEHDADIPAHSHAEQWEIVLEGMVDVTIDGKTARYRKGDRMHIPAGVVHAAFVHAGFCSMAYFDQPDRYRAVIK